MRPFAGLAEGADDCVRRREADKELSVRFGPGEALGQSFRFGPKF